MSSSANDGNNEGPRLTFRSPTFQPDPSTPSGSRNVEESRLLHRRKAGKHIQLDEPPRPNVSSSSNVYHGSYRHHRRSRSSVGDGNKTPETSAPPTPRVSIIQNRLSPLLQDLDPDIETYGLEELRDGFFDASFHKSTKIDQDELFDTAEYNLSAAFEKKHPLSLAQFLPGQWDDFLSGAHQVLSTRVGIKLLRSFLAVFVAYVLCLIPVTRDWLGRYNYIIVVSCIINHPGRALGAQIDGAVHTILGTGSGLGFGAFALWVSDSTSVARRGYGGILATFLLVYIAAIAALRSYFIRFYQLVLCAGIAICYTVLANTSEKIGWGKLFDYGIPFVLGQAICFAVCCTVFPDAGSRNLAVSLHSAFGVMLEALKLPRPNSIVQRRTLAGTFVNLSQAYRDLVIDLSISKFHPDDVQILRNLMQGVIRSLLSLKTETTLFNNAEESNHGLLQENSVINISSPRIVLQDELHAVRLVSKHFAAPTKDLLTHTSTALARCDAILMSMSGYRKFIGPPESDSSDLIGALAILRKAMIKFDEEDRLLMANPRLPSTYSNNPNVVELFLFVNPIRQVANSAEALAVKVNEMQQKHRSWRIYLPSYPFIKSLGRSNPQVRHDRGGLTAGHFFRSQKQLAKTMRDMQSTTYKPSKAFDIHNDPDLPETSAKVDHDVVIDDQDKISKKATRYRVWEALHDLQGFESRYALKTCIIISLLSIPAWLQQSRYWFNLAEAWWAVVTAWMMSHPRVGGSFQDLVTRSLFAMFGAVWGGLAFAARDGNPYVMAVFCLIYMIPMMFRYTQSPHPRSGIVGCISFVVVSLSLYTEGGKINGESAVAKIAWTRGVCFVIGVVSSVVVNWILWPFVARHELRKSLSAMLLHCAFVYRGVVSKYVYYEGDHEPAKEDIARSEMLEGRLREGFVRIRQLMALTRHEIRLRGPFNPLPYAGLIEACERFFEHLVEIRTASVFFHPQSYYMTDVPEASELMLASRRDAVASILMNIYIFAGALRSDRPLPRYLPSAAVARKKLLDEMAEVEAQQVLAALSRNEGDAGAKEKRIGGKRWADVYQYAYSAALTDIVEELEEMRRFVTAVVGEKGFDVDKGVAM